MGRPVLGDAFRKGEVFKLRLTKTDKQMLNELSESNGTNASDYIRKIIADEYILFSKSKNAK